MEYKTTQDWINTFEAKASETCSDDDNIDSSSTWTEFLDGVSSMRQGIKGGLYGEVPQAEALQSSEHEDEVLKSVPGLAKQLDEVLEPIDPPLEDAEKLVIAKRVVLEWCTVLPEALTYIEIVARVGKEVKELEAAATIILASNAAIQKRVPLLREMVESIDLQWISLKETERQVTVVVKESLAAIGKVLTKLTVKDVTSNCTIQ